MLQNFPQRLLKLCLCGFVFCVAVLAETPGVWLDVPFFKQEKDGCGAASIAMVMQYWRKQKAEPIDAGADPAAIQQALFSSREHGIRASDMERYFQQHGFQTYAFS